MGKKRFIVVGLYALKESRAFPKHCKRVDYKGKFGVSLIRTKL